jgi:hypothetical protein
MSAMNKNKQGLWSAMGLAVISSLVLSACGDKATADISAQIGANPSLPKAQDFLMPPMQVPGGVGWKGDQSPKVAPGLKIEKDRKDCFRTFASTSALYFAEWRHPGGGGK